MQFRKIGTLDVSVIGLGCSNFGRALNETETIELVHAAFDLGINFFDTANIYNAGLSEAFLGKALKGRRDEAIVSTKFGKVRSTNTPEVTIDASREQIRHAIEESLHRLRTDHIDLFILHTPDPKTPIIETIAALNEIIHDGKVLEIGCSSVDVGFLSNAKQAAEENGLRPFVNVQNRYNLLDGEREQEKGVVRECEASGLSFVPYSPLASGMLSGKYQRNVPPPSGTRLADRPIGEYSPETLLTDNYFDIVERLTSYAAASGHSAIELAFAALLARPVFASVIAGATTRDQLAANVRAPSWRLSAAELEEVMKLAQLND